MYQNAIYTVFLDTAKIAELRQKNADDIRVCQVI